MKVQLTGIYYKGWVENGATCVNSTVRLAIVHDKRPTGSLPAITDIYETIDANTRRNELGFGRFTVIKEWDCMLKGQGTAGTENPQENYIKRLKGGKKIKIFTRYKGATGGIGEITQGALYLVTMGDKASVSAGSDADMYFRIHFKDIR